MFERPKISNLPSLLWVWTASNLRLLGGFVWSPSFAYHLFDPVLTLFHATFSTYSNFRIYQNHQNYQNSMLCRWIETSKPPSIFHDYFAHPGSLPRAKVVHVPSGVCSHSKTVQKSQVNL